MSGAAASGPAPADDGSPPPTPRAEARRAASNGASSRSSAAARAHAATGRTHGRRDVGEERAAKQEVRDGRRAPTADRRGTSRDAPARALAVTASAAPGRRRSANGVAPPARRRPPSSAASSHAVATAVPSGEVDLPAVGVPRHTASNGGSSATTTRPARRSGVAGRPRRRLLAVSRRRRRPCSPWWSPSVGLLQTADASGLVARAGAAAHPVGDADGRPGRRVRPQRGGARHLGAGDDHLRRPEAHHRPEGDGLHARLDPRS